MEARERVEGSEVMVSAKDCVASSGLCKLAASAKMPAIEVLRTLSAAEVRLLQRRLAQPVECVFDPSFQQAGIETLYLGPAVQSGPTPGNDDSGMDWLAVGAGWSTTQERHAFLRLNYCRYRVMEIVRECAGRRLSAAAAAEVLRWERLAAETREGLVRVNMPLVLAMAKRTRITGADFSDLVSEGSLALLRSVDKFDCRRGYKFSTYACRSILKSFSRVAARTARHRGRFPAEFDPALEKSDFLEQKRSSVEGDCIAEIRTILGDNLAKLSEVERQVIRARFALDEPSNGQTPKGKTLEEVGALIGVTKERVRQIQNKALDKLRNVLEEVVLAR